MRSGFVNHYYFFEMMVCNALRSYWIRSFSVEVDRYSRQMVDSLTKKNYVSDRE